MASIEDSVPSLSRVPVAEGTRDRLIRMLSDGSFREGDRLPSEQEMARSLRVSRTTIREAYKSLVDLGYLVRRHGQGTFVRGVPNHHSLESTLSYTAMIEQAGKVPSVVVLERRLRESDASEARRLDSPKGSTLWEMERVRTADGRAIIYSVDRIPAEHVPEDIRDTYSGSLFELLNQLGMAPTRGLARLQPRVATSEIASILEVRAGDPLLYFEETDYDQSGKPVMLSSEWHVADAIEFWLHRRAQP